MVLSATLVGVEGRPVGVEVHVSNGLPGFTVVGLPDAACRESRDRVRAALLSSGLPWPLRRVTVNLAPSGVRKGGAVLDLPIAVGLLAATGQVPAEGLAGTAFLGEVGLDGSVRAVPGLVPLVDAIAARTVVVAESGATDASVVGRHRVVGVATLAQLVAGLKRGTLRGRTAPRRDRAARGFGVEGAPPPPSSPAAATSANVPSSRTRADPEPDLADVRGQLLGRRALEVAAAGGHHLLLVGPPGSGKSMLARRLPGILPSLEPGEALEVGRVWSAAGWTLQGLPGRPPFRSPHHGASSVALIGGGTAVMRPGEVSLAHRGVLFLDEMAEFAGGVLDALRQPMEEGCIEVARARSTSTFPARFLLVGAMNPCPCGEGGPPGSCRCGEADRARYRRRLSGPLLDRFDLRVAVGRPDVAEIVRGSPAEPSSVVAERVRAARARAVDRGFRANSDIPSRRLDELAPLAPGAVDLLERRLRSGRLSARGYDRVRRVALIITDLAGRSGEVGERQVAEALSLRAATERLDGTR